LEQNEHLVCLEEEKQTWEASPVSRLLHRHESDTIGCREKFRRHSFSARKYTKKTLLPAAVDPRVATNQQEHLKNQAGISTASLGDGEQAPFVAPS